MDSTRSGIVLQDFNTSYATGRATAKLRKTVESACYFRLVSCCSASGDFLILGDVFFFYKIQVIQRHGQLSPTGTSQEPSIRKNLFLNPLPYIGNNFLFNNILSFSIIFLFLLNIKNNILKITNLLLNNYLYFLSVNFCI